MRALACHVSLFAAFALACAGCEDQGFWYDCTGRAPPNLRSRRVGHRIECYCPDGWVCHEDRFDPDANVPDTAPSLLDASLDANAGPTAGAQLDGDLDAVMTEDTPSPPDAAVADDSEDGSSATDAP